MNQTEKRKQEQIEALETAYIESIVNAERPEHLQEPSAEYPLAGQVRIEGIGNVTLADLRAELQRRTGVEEVQSTAGQVKAGDRMLTSSGWQTVSAVKPREVAKRPGVLIEWQTPNPGGGVWVESTELRDSQAVTLRPGG